MKEDLDYFRIQYLLGEEDAENNFFDNDSEYRDDKQNHCEEIKCSFHRLDECGYTLIYSYDRDLSLIHISEPTRPY